MNYEQIDLFYEISGTFLTFYRWYLDNAAVINIKNLSMAVKIIGMFSFLPAGT
jgi:hypothetical protein